MKRMTVLFASLLPLAVAACDDHGHSHDEGELITTAILTFTPASDPAVVAEFDDADGDGGAAPTVDPINLTAGTTYTLTLAFENRLETPAEDITQEVRDEAEDHQVFLTGSAVNGPATSNASAPLTHTYGDTDANGMPLGLTNQIVAATGTGQLVVTLRHVPPLNNTAVKTATLADDVKAGGISSIGGDTDVSATFDVTVP